MWYQSDRDRNDVLDTEELVAFLEAVSAKWGGGEWKKGSASSPVLDTWLSQAAEVGGARGSPGARRGSGSPGSAGFEVEWETVRKALWDSPVDGVRAPTIILLQTSFRAAAGHGSSTLGAEPAQALARKLLKANCAEKGVIERVCAALEGPSVVDFEAFVAAVGPELQESVARALGVPHARIGLRQGRNCLGCGKHQSDNDLSLDGIVNSKYAERDGTACEVLLNGEDCFGAMLEEIKRAESEIMMGWWQFCPWLPGIRSAERGSAAYETDWDSAPSGTYAEGHDWATLPPVLKAKAEAGVKIYSESSSSPPSDRRQSM